MRTRKLTEQFFKDFDPKLEPVKYAQGEQIIAENEAAESVYFICKGKVEISKGLKQEEPQHAQLSVLEAGEIFGEMGIITEEPRSASVYALEDTELMSIPKELFIRIATTYPEILFDLTRTLSGRLRDTNERFVTLMDEMIRQNRLMAIGMAASKIIHDIKTPLTVIVLTAQLIENLFPGSGEFSQSIVKQTRLIDQLVREILDFARGVESTPLIQKINLSDFFDELTEINQATLQGRNIEFVVENKVTDFVYFDGPKIRRALMNLIKNSSEAMTSDGKIKILASTASGWLQISVMDDGPGVPPAIRDSIFQPFVSEGKNHGTGLGLPICRKLVQEHRGRLEYVPISGGGSRFDIRIPQSIK
jgi:signal transduction histidine kinase